MKNFARLLRSIFESMNMRRAKGLILFIFIALLGLDIIFVASDKFPTISQIVFDSSPRYFVIIWLFGLGITNIFFQRETSKAFNLFKNFIILFSITIVFLVLGLMIKQPDTINCSNYKTEIPKFEMPFVTRILCQSLTKGSSIMQIKKCQSFNCEGDINFKMDLTVQMKFLILLSGIILGYILWPSKPLPPSPS